eukprot:scaffold34567_cov66-Cyclotella_meneghiniana.AAC.6
MLFCNGTLRIIRSRASTTLLIIYHALYCQSQDNGMMDGTYADEGVCNNGAYDHAYQQHRRGGFAG